MSALRTLSALMKADILERTRGYSFLVTIAAALYLGYLVNDGTIGSEHGELPAGAEFGLDRNGGCALHHDVRRPCRILCR